MGYFFVPLVATVDFAHFAHFAHFQTLYKVNSQNRITFYLIKENALYK